MKLTDWPATFYVEKSKIEKFRSLHGEGKPFKGELDLFLTAAAIGKRLRLRETLKPPKESLTRSSYFSEERMAIAIAIAMGDNPNFEMCNEEIVKTLEEYANAGINELLERANKTDQNVENLAAYILQTVSQEQTK